MALCGIAASSSPVSAAASSSPVSTIRIILPLIGLGFAVIVNAAWIGFLGYFLLKLDRRASVRRSITRRLRCRGRELQATCGHFSKVARSWPSIPQQPQGQLW